MNRRELCDPNLTELKMSPGNLRNLAAKIPAMVGIEYELAAKRVKNSPDHSGGVNSFEDIEDYFVSGSSLNSVIRRLERLFGDWRLERILYHWDSTRGDGWFRVWIKQNVDTQTMADELGLDSDTDADAGTLIDNFLERCRDQQNHWWEQAQEDFFRDHESDYTEQEFLRDHDLITYEQVQYQYDELEFPDQDNSSAYENVALELERVLRKPTRWSATYHGVFRGDWYCVEPDSSINLRDRQRDLPVEIVSPPQSLSETLADYRTIRDWALSNDHYTNPSTGLHINLSLPGKPQADLDWVKLVLLSGDEWVLNQFGRQLNHYAENALEMIHKTIERNRPQTPDPEGRADPVIQNALLNLTSNKLDQFAKNLANKLMNRAHISIVGKSDRIEVRSPGGNWLGTEPAVIENTLYRYVIALDAALSPDKYRQDYLKKLYQLIRGGEQGELAPLFKLQLGIITRDQFRSLIRSQYQTRQNGQNTV